MRTAGAATFRSLEPARLTVTPGVPRTVKLAFVGEVASHKKHSSAVTGVALVSGKDRFRIVSSSLDRTLETWVPGSDGDAMVKLSSPARCLAASADGMILASSGGNSAPPFEFGVQLWNGFTGKPQGEPVLQDSRQFTTALAVTGDGKRLLATTKREVVLWDIDGKSAKVLEGPGTTKVATVAFDPLGKWALTGDGDGFLTLWSVTEARQVKRLIALSPGSSGGIHAVVFTANGFASVGDDNIIRLWDLTTFKARELPVQPKPVKSLAASKDGKRLLSGSEDGKVKLWSVVDGTLTYTFAGHADSVNAIAFTPDGRGAVSGGTDQTVRLWRLPFE